MKRFFLLTLFFAFYNIHPQTNEIPTLILNDLLEKYDLCDKDLPMEMQVLKDRNRDLKFSTITKLNLPFQSCSDVPAKIRERALPYWFRFKVRNESKNFQEWILEIPYPLLDKIEIYSDQKIFWRDSPIYSGDNNFGLDKRNQKYTVSFQDGRDFEYKNFSYNLHIPQNTEATIYIRVETEGAVIVPVVIRNHKAFIDYINNVNFAQGIYIGIILVMIFYNLIIYFSIYKSIYIYYILSILSFSLWISSVNGLSFEWVFFKYPSIGNIFPLVTMPLYVLFSGLFAKKFLSNEDTIQNFNKVFRLNYWFLLTIPLAPITSYYWLLQIQIAYTIGFCFFLVWIAFFYKNQFKFGPANYYLTACIPLLICLTLHRFKVWGFANEAFWNSNELLQVCSIWEAIFLSLAMREKLIRLRLDKEKADELLIEKQKELMNSYARFVPFELLGILNKSEITSVRLGDAIKKEMTVLFSDVRSFTSISEKMSPEENFEFLNDILRDISPVIRENNGFIDKYIGDAVMALFPIKPDDAIKSALSMLHSIQKFNSKRVEEGLLPIQIGIGINTGEMIFGTIGEEQRMEATVISDAVNLASRVEGLTKHYGAHIIIAEQTFKKLTDVTHYNFRKLDIVKVKGKEEKVTIYEILDNEESEVEKLKQETKEKFESALNLFFKNKFRDSKKLFKEILKTNPEDKAAKMYLDRADLYIKEKIKLQDGFTEMKTK
ncbi:MAG TPA: adenylate/guanylate cyclase domain-containing protein [Leptospiraceae bacterium]|nr:adenylate/guanylate cyclase domain-containing protein [Leptospiraceae bacterium]HMW04955.1 adenylate/guanylate cyclase domain-containing protein [Leptospiraceae bacterium]HMX31896.1 adenylate/guanylate cyclase domain-containing protein [Leptospiraceae bacterium]HMY30824.1 adenylate/guanylate cyclase domain-containing protein [Leptospiraceae bacterium]HMZ64285.1 adenylate/guanylate cyclase domain-containing protein [Leptospiraceae bacterium]